MSQQTSVLYRVGERFAQEATCSQRVHFAFGVIHHVGVTAVRVKGQRAVLAGFVHAVARRDRGARVTNDLVGQNADDCFGVSGIDIGVVGQDVAYGVRSSGAVGNATSLLGDRLIVLGHRRIVVAFDRDGQCADVFESEVVADGVEECVGQCIGAQAQRLNGGVVVVHRVRVRAGAADGQRSIKTRDRDGGPRRDWRFGGCPVAPGAGDGQVCRSCGR